MVSRIVYRRCSSGGLFLIEDAKNLRRRCLCSVVFVDSWYGCGSLAELTEFPGSCTNVVFEPVPALPDPG